MFGVPFLLFTPKSKPKKKIEPTKPQPTNKAVEPRPLAAALARARLDAADRAMKGELPRIE